MLYIVVRQECSPEQTKKQLEKVHGFFYIIFWDNDVLSIDCIANHIAYDMGKYVYEKLVFNQFSCPLVGGIIKEQLLWPFKVTTFLFKYNDDNTLI